MNIEEIKAREQKATTGNTVKIIRYREDLKKLDELGENALKSEKLMDLVVNGATLMSVNKDTLRGIIRVIITGAAAKVERLTAENKEEVSRRYQAECNYDHTVKDRDTLKKALELACEEISDYALPSGTGRMKSVLITARIEKFMNHAKQAQEQEGKE